MICGVTGGIIPPGEIKKGPRGRWRWPKHAHGGRPAGSEPVFEVRASPEMRPGSHTTGPQPPKRASVICKDAGEHSNGCLR